MAQTAKEKAKLIRAGYKPPTRKEKRASALRHAGDTRQAMLNKIELLEEDLNAWHAKWEFEVKHGEELAAEIERRREHEQKLHGLLQESNDMLEEYKRALSAAVRETRRDEAFYLEGE